MKTFLITLFLYIVSCSGKGGFQGSQPGGSDIPPPPPGPPCVTATVEWDPPTTMGDGSPIPPGKLVGYKLYQGFSSALYSQEYDIPGDTTDTYILPGLNKDVPFYFAMKSVANDGSTSTFSNEYRYISSICKSAALSFRKRHKK